MGIPASTSFEKQTGPAIRKLLGNGMHTASIGQVVGLGVLIKSGLIHWPSHDLTGCRTGQLVGKTALTDQSGVTSFSISIASLRLSPHDLLLSLKSSKLFRFRFKHNN